VDFPTPVLHTALEEPPMQAVRIETTVLPGKRIEIESPELPEGAVAEVIVLVPEAQAPRASMLDFIASLPPGPRLFETPAEADAHLRQERDAWQR
jgi:hypothetical protein